MCSLPLWFAFFFVILITILLLTGRLDSKLSVFFFCILSCQFCNFFCYFIYAGYCAFVDAEHALDPALAEAIGVNTQNLLLSQPDSGEQALSLVDTLIRSGAVDVVVVDSVRKISFSPDILVSFRFSTSQSLESVCVYTYACFYAFPRVSYPSFWDGGVIFPLNYLLFSVLLTGRSLYSFEYTLFLWLA